MHLAKAPPSSSRRAIGCALEKVEIGMRVEVTFEDWNDEISIAKFRPAP